MSVAGVVRRLVVALLALAVVGACSGGDGADDASPGSDDTAAEEAAEATAPAPPAPSPPGSGVVVVGGTSSTFEVTSCRLEPDPSEPEGARALVALAGSGETARGDAFSVEVQRFATGTDVQTFTDTVVYTDTARILQAQRIEVGGQVTDLRDPDATSPLLRVRDDGLSLSGLASGPGEDAEDGGLIGLALDATC